MDLSRQRRTENYTDRGDSTTPLSRAWSDFIADLRRQSAPPPEIIPLPPKSPTVLPSRLYPTETNKDFRDFSWMKNDQEMQNLFPIETGEDSLRGRMPLMQGVPEESSPPDLSGITVLAPAPPQLNLDSPMDFSPREGEAPIPVSPPGSASSSRAEDLIRQYQNGLPLPSGINIDPLRARVSGKWTW